MWRERVFRVEVGFREFNVELYFVLISAQKNIICLTFWTTSTGWWGRTCDTTQCPGRFTSELCLSWVVAMLNPLPLLFNLALRRSPVPLNFPHTPPPAPPFLILLSLIRMWHTPEWTFSKSFSIVCTRCCPGAESSLCSSSSLFVLGFWASWTFFSLRAQLSKL